MRIIKKAAVKHVLTDKMREKMVSDFHRDQRQLNKEIEQLRFQMQKQWKTADTGWKKTEIKERYDKEIEKRKEKVKHSEFQLTQLEQLPPGTEIGSREVDVIEEVAEGDEWPSQNQEIVVQDGIITQIRNKRSDDENGMV
ncbi:YlqD family protein [Salibacterium halotolerans]|uniref:YlqD protein n=1 Tax=Salibacterium halotolerans TaxID=1884432 RepID=A0A1I5MB48_9BACI|nr:YlqD family protein [Salibacterium halotolerans]SFP06713.1 YlqD protein [Salibacterium halotolerans]